MAIDNVYVFPSVQKNSVESRSFTEENVANLIYNFVCRDAMGTSGSPSGKRYGFVITDTGADANNDPIPYEPSNDSIFEFNILGYYFKVTGDFTVGFSEDIWASIKIKTVSEQNLTPYNELYVNTSTQENPFYYGVVFSDQEHIPVAETGETVYSLKILSKDGDDWIIPNDSKIRFNPSTVGLDVIDGGEW